MAILRSCSSGSDFAPDFSGVKIGEQESKLIKNEEDLKIAQENCADALYKAS